jgi:hypothetical protein
MSANWKGNVGNQSIIEDYELTDEFKMWADEVRILCLIEPNSHLY